jgi:MFS family permease
VAIVIAGTAMGTGTTTIYAVAGGLLPSDAHATGFGIMTTASLLGLAVSPVVAGVIGAAGLRIVFVADVFLLLILAGLVFRGLQARSPAGRDSGDAALADP